MAQDVPARLHARADRSCDGHGAATPGRQRGGGGETTHRQASCRVEVGRVLGQAVRALARRFTTRLGVRAGERRMAREAQRRVGRGEHSRAVAVPARPRVDARQPPDPDRVHRARDGDDRRRRRTPAAGAAVRHHGADRGLHPHRSVGQRRLRRQPVLGRSHEVAQGGGGLPRLRRGLEPARERVLLLRRRGVQQEHRAAGVGARRGGRPAGARRRGRQVRRRVQRRRVHADPQSPLRRSGPEPGQGARAVTREPLCARDARGARDRPR